MKISYLKAKKKAKNRERDGRGEAEGWERERKERWKVGGVEEKGSNKVM